jgi:dipeptidyl aminopeptidase/acylaminoacyl peptidase
MKDVHLPDWQLQSPAIDREGGHAAFVEGFASDRICVTGTVTVVDLKNGESRKLAPELDVAHVRWLADGRLFYTAIVGLETSCGVLSADGTTEELWRGAAMMGLAGPRAATCSEAKTIVAAVDAHGVPHELCELVAAEGRWNPLTAVNAHLTGLLGPDAERVAWHSADGLEIEGILLQPPGLRGQPLPLVVAIHGGPVGAHGFGFLRPTELAIANAGYAVLLPNPRGSAGRGQEFAQGVRHDMGGAELQDTLAGVDELRERGTIDGNRVGITGFSHGGFISAWAPTQTDVFRASVPRGCVSNWLSFHNTSNIGRWDELFLGSNPYDPNGDHFARSPVVHSQKCKTPTLVMHGELDLSAPVGQARELYQALVEAECETQLVIYPRAGHGWREREQVLDSCERMVAWFDRYLAS